MHSVGHWICPAGFRLEYQWAGGEQRGRAIGVRNCTVDNPNSPNQPTQANQSVQLYCGEPLDTSTYQVLSNSLTIWNLNNPGHVLLNIRVDVHETYGTTDVSSGSALVTLDTQQLNYESRYYADGARCAREARTKIVAEIGNYEEYKWIVDIILTSLTLLLKL